MTPPLAAFLATNLHGFGADPFTDVGLAALGLEGMGGPVRSLARRGIQRFRSRRGDRKLQRIMRYLMARGYSVQRMYGLGLEGMGDEEIDGLAYELGIDDDDMGGFGGFGADDDDMGDDPELAALEAECDELEADDEDMGADDDEMGGAADRLTRKIGKLEAKLQRLQDKYDSTPAMRWRKRQRIAKRIAKVRAAIARKEAKRERKLAILAAKMGVPVAALAAGGAGGLASQQVAAMARGRADMAEGIAGVTQRSPRRGVEMRIPFVDPGTGAPVTVWQVTGGAGLRTVALALQTVAITYARFRVVGLDVRIQANADPTVPNELLLTALAQSLMVTGGKNLLYQTENVSFAGQVKDGVFSASRTIAGLRDDEIMEENETASFAGVLRQEITTSQNINGTFEAALVVEQLADSKLRRLTG